MMQIDYIQELFADLAPIPQDDGPEPVVAIQYPADFVKAMDIFRAVLLAKEFSKRSLLLSEHIIQINSANYTAWQFRRQILDAVGGDWGSELKLCDSIAEISSKNYQLWCHRRETIKRLRNPSSELAHTASVFAEDPKNYHAWGHRQWVIEEFGLWDGELEYIEELLVQDPFNNSAWNQRWFAVTRNNTIPAWDDIEILQREIQLAVSHLEKVVDNESPWNYLLGIVDKIGFRKDIVSSVATWSESILESNPRCRFAAAFLFELYEAADLPKRLERAEQLSSLLESEIDKVRAKYWAWRREQLRPKQDDL